MRRENGQDPMPVSSGSATDKGLRRSTNEDSLLVRGDLGLFVVADGMGGHAAGEVASQVAVEGIAAFVEATVTVSPDQTWPVPFDARESVDANRLRAGFCMANHRLAARVASSRELRGMATTAVAMLVDGDAGTLAHVGDSRAYLLRQARIARLTRDHSWVEEQIQAGTLSEAAARRHPWRNVVTRALSGAADLDVEIQALRLEPRDRVLLCTDGIFSVLGDERIGDILGRDAGLDDLCSMLIEETNDGGGPDNATAVVIEVDAR